MRKWSRFAIVVACAAVAAMTASALEWLPYMVAGYDGDRYRVLLSMRAELVAISAATTLIGGALTDLVGGAVVACFCAIASGALLLHGTGAPFSVNALRLTAAITPLAVPAIFGEIARASRRWRGLVAAGAIGAGWIATWIAWRAARSALERENWKSALDAMAVVALVVGAACVPLFFVRARTSGDGEPLRPPYRAPPPNAASTRTFGASLREDARHRALWVIVVGAALVGPAQHFLPQYTINDAIRVLDLQNIGRAPYARLVATTIAVPLGLALFDLVPRRRAAVACVPILLAILAMFAVTERWVPASVNAFAIGDALMWFIAPSLRFVAADFGDERTAGTRSAVVATSMSLGAMVFGAAVLGERAQTGPNMSDVTVFVGCAIVGVVLLAASAWARDFRLETRAE